MKQEMPREVYIYDHDDSLNVHTNPAAHDFNDQEYIRKDIHQKLIEAADKVVIEMETFCQRVEIGEVKSIKSYKAFRSALQSYRETQEMK